MYFRDFVILYILSYRSTQNIVHRKEHFYIKQHKMNSHTTQIPNHINTMLWFCHITIYVSCMMCSWYYQMKLSRPLVAFIWNILIYCSASGFMVTMLAYLVFHPIVLSFSNQGHQVPT